MRTVFICSRFAGTPTEITRNIEVAKKLCRKAALAGRNPFAPHLLYPQFLTDNDCDERKIGLACGRQFMRHCDEIWIYIADGISGGMEDDIAFAKTVDNLRMRIISTLD